jgi:hypothetical protein
MFLPKGISSAIDPSARIRLRFANHLTVVKGHCANNHAAKRDMPVNKICFALIAKEEPLVVKPVTCAADTTIKSPKAKTASEVIKKVIKMLLGVRNI